MMKLLVVLILFLVFVAPVSAHVLKTDGDIGAVMHIFPDDDPIVDQSANLFFEIKDKKGIFKWTDCECKMHILQEGKEQYVGPLGQSGSSYAFPSRGIYQVQMTGESVSHTFPAFSLGYDVRVSRKVGQADQQVVTLWQRIVEWLKHLFGR